MPVSIRGCRVGHSRQGQTAQWHENGHQAGSRDKRKAIAELTVFSEGSLEPGAQSKVVEVSFEKQEVSRPPARMLHREVQTEL